MWGQDRAETETATPTSFRVKLQRVSLGAREGFPPPMGFVPITAPQLFLQVALSCELPKQKGRMIEWQNILHWKRAIRIIKSSSLFLAGLDETKSFTKSIVWMLLEFWQAWCHDHFPGEAVPGTNPPSEKPFPSTQPELSGAASFHLVVFCSLSQAEEISTSTACLEEGVPCCEVPPLPSPSWTNQLTLAFPH